MKNNGHELYKPSDFKGSAKYSELGIAVIDGGLSVCKKCGEYEAGLNSQCKATINKVKKK